MIRVKERGARRSVAEIRVYEYGVKADGPFLNDGLYVVGAGCVVNCKV